MTLTPSLMAVAKDDPNRFQIGIQEYTFHRWLGKKLTHLDYPAFVKEKLGITHVEYWNRPFAGKHTDKKYMAELVKRTKNEGIKNVLILVDERNQLDAVKYMTTQTAIQNRSPGYGVGGRTFPMAHPKLAKTLAMNIISSLCF